jgi:taurine---2-oxoglutarate transaminase
LVPFNATGAAATPMVQFAAACKAEGLWPFVHMHRTHVAPPCVITADEVRQGVAILDRALEVADRYTTSA